MSDGPKQYVVLPDEIITGRANVRSVSSEAGEHVGPAYPLDGNDGNMLPYQETYGTFTEAEIDYRVLKSGGIGSATWGWKHSTDSNDKYRGVGDPRFQTGFHNPFRDIEGKQNIADMGLCIIVSKVHNRLLLIRRNTASSTEGAIKIAYRDLGSDDKQKYTTYTFQPSAYFTDEDVECQMIHVGGCELPDGTLRLVANTYNSSDSTHDLHLFGSNDGGITWKLLQQNIISRWFNQSNKTVFPGDVRKISNLKMASSGDWMRIVWYGSNSGYLQTMASSDRGATWESLDPTPFKCNYQPKISSKLIDGTYDTDSIVDAGGMSVSEGSDGWNTGKIDVSGVCRNLIRDEYDHISSTAGSKNYFDVVSLGGSEGSFLLVVQPRMTASIDESGGFDATKSILLCSGVRDSNWAISRAIQSPDGYALRETSSVINSGRDRCFRQPNMGFQQVVACATPFWIYIYIFVTPGQTGDVRDPGYLFYDEAFAPGGWGPGDPGNIHEPFGGGNGYGSTWEDGGKTPMPGPWGCTYLGCGWIGYRIPVASAFNGVIQKLHVSNEDGFPFPVSAGQGKMFVPHNVRVEWAGDRVVMLNGLTYNGAHDAYRNGAQLGCNSTTPPSLFPYGRNTQTSILRYGKSYQKNTDTSGLGAGMRGLLIDRFYRIPAVPDGYGRRGNPIDQNYLMDTDGVTHLGIEGASRAHTVVSYFGGWDQRPLQDPNGFDIGQEECAPMMCDSWSADCGLPHINAIGNGRLVGSWVDGSTNDYHNNGSYNIFFNIIGPATPDRTEYSHAFNDTAQGLSMGSETCLKGGVLSAVSASMWTTKSTTIGGGGDLEKACAWTRYDRDQGIKTLDWESDRVIFRKSFHNTRTDMTHTAGDVSYLYFTTNRMLHNSGDIELRGGTSEPFAYYPDRFNLQYGSELWGRGTTDDIGRGYNYDVLTGLGYTSDEVLGWQKGRGIALGNSGMISFVCSVPSDGLRGADENYNKPQVNVEALVSAAGGFRYAAVQVKPKLEVGGSFSGGQLRISDICVAMGVDGSGNDIAVLIDQADYDIPAPGTPRIPTVAATLSLGRNAFGTPDEPVFWEFRLIMFRSGSTQKARLHARRYGYDEPFIKTSSESFTTRDMAGYVAAASYDGAEYYDTQSCGWGVIDSTPADDHEYMALWKEFNVSHTGTGGYWRQTGASNPEELSGMVCSSGPAYVTGGIHAKWGGGGAFRADVFNGTIDHTYAVENVFKPSPSTKWKTDATISGTNYKHQPEGEISFSASSLELSSEDNLRSNANFIALYGTQDREMIVDVSYKSDFRSSQTVSYLASALLMEAADVSAVSDNAITIVDANATNANNLKFPEGSLAGKYVGWYDASIQRRRCAKILTNQYGDSSSEHLIFVDPANLSDGMDFDEKRLIEYGLSVSSTIDIWSDRAVVDLLSADNQLAIPSGISASVFRKGFSFVRIRFPGSETMIVGSTRFGGRYGHSTIDGQHTLGTMILGRGINFDVPLQWEHTDSTEPNVNIVTTPSGQKTAYKMSDPRRTISFTMPGDIDSFRTRLQNVLDSNADYTKKPLALLLQADSNTTLADDRFNILARYSGSFSNENVGWKRDTNNVWVPIGDVSLTFDEEL